MREYPKAEGDWQNMSKKDVDYRVGTEDECCKKCTMFRPPSSCTLVEGKIKPTGLCDYFKRKQ